MEIMFILIGVGVWCICKVIANRIEAETKDKYPEQFKKEDK